MNKNLLVAFVVAASFHGIVLFGFELFREAGTATETIELVSGDLVVAAPPPLPESEEDTEEDSSDEPVIPEDLINSGLTEPPSSDVALSALSQIVKPEPPRPARPSGIDSALIPTGAARASNGRGGIPDIVFDLSDLDRPPRELNVARPAYPIELMRNRISGSVVAVWTVDKEGRVVDVQIQSATHPEFKPSVLASIRKCRFEPGMKNGRPVFFKVRREFTFDMSN